MSCAKTQSVTNRSPCLSFGNAATIPPFLLKLSWWGHCVCTMKIILQFCTLWRHEEWMLLSCRPAENTGITDEQKHVHKRPFTEANSCWVTPGSPPIPEVRQGPFAQRWPMANGIPDDAGFIWAHPLPIELQRGRRPIKIRNRLHAPQLCPSKQEAVLLLLQEAEATLCKGKSPTKGPPQPFQAAPPAPRPPAPSPPAALPARPALTAGLPREGGQAAPHCPQRRALRHAAPPPRTATPTRPRLRPGRRGEAAPPPRATPAGQRCPRAGTAVANDHVFIETVLRHGVQMNTELKTAPAQGASQCKKKKKKKQMVFIFYKFRKRTFKWVISPRGRSIKTFINKSRE